jgi:cytochrome P450
MSAPATYRETADSEPFEFYRRGRDGGGVIWDESMDAWLVTSYAACRDLLRDDENFGSAFGEVDRDTYIAIRGGPRQHIFLMGEQHHRVHRWWLQMLSPRVVPQWRANVATIVNALLDTLLPRGRAELVADFADHVPFRVIASLLGLPWQDDAWAAESKQLMRTMHGYLNGFAHEQASADVRDAAIRAAQELNELLLPHVEARRSGVGDDIISRLWRDGPSLLDGWSVTDVLAETCSMFNAGSQTTVRGIANALYVLLTDPGVQDELREGGEARMVAFVEESMRVLGIAHFVPRVALHDTVVGGVEIEQGQLVLALTAAANRDEQQFEHADRIDLSRPLPRDHIGFGVGPRTCPGAPLARTEIQIAVEEVLARTRELRLDPEAPQPRFTGFITRSYRPLHALFSQA